MSDHKTIEMKISIIHHPDDSFANVRVTLWDEYQIDSELPLSLFLEFVRYFGPVVVQNSVKQTRLKNS